MMQVSMFAGRCLNVVDALFDRRAPQVLGQYRQRPVKPPAGLTETELNLLQQRISAGATRWLATRGWTHDGLSLTEGNTDRRGPVWTRDPPALHFGPATFRVISWLAAGDVQAPPGTAVSNGDHLVFTVAHSLDPFAGGALEEGSAMTQLAWPDSSLVAPDLKWLVSDEMSPLIGALQPWLAERWRTFEAGKSGVVVPSRLVELGTRQARVVEAWIDVCQTADRPDLATFLIEAVRRLPGPAEWWVTNLDDTASLRDRQAARQAAAALLRGVARIREWGRALGAVHFIDDGYDTAQATLAHWRDWAVTLDRAAEFADHLAAPPRRTP